MGGPGSVTTAWDHNRAAAGPQDRGKPQCRARAPKSGEESSGLRAGLHSEGPEGGPDPHQWTPFLSTRGCRPVFSLPHNPCTYSSVRARTHTCARTHTHTHTHTRCVCSPGRHLSRNLLPALISLLHPSRYLWREEGGGQRAEGRGQRSSTSQLHFGGPLSPA